MPPVFASSPAWIVAHTCVPETAIPTGLPPTTMRFTRFVAGSIQPIVPSPESATQTPESDAAIPIGSLPIPSGIVFTTPALGSTRITLGGLPSSTQTDPAPTVTASGDGAAYPGRSTRRIEPSFAPVERSSSNRVAF